MPGELRLGAGVLAVALSLSAQPAYDVASIRPHTGRLHTIMGFTLSGSRVAMEGYTVQQFIMEAYGLKGTWQVSQAPVRGKDELLSVYYDLAARAPGDKALTREESRLMLQALLADRFRLSIHRETKETPVYALFVGKGGHKLSAGKAGADCSINVGVVAGGQSYGFRNCAISDLNDMLSNGLVDRPVVDRTELTGKFDFRFVATPSFMNRDRADSTELSPFTAIQDLGLKLQPQTAPMEIVVVDRVEKPTEN